MTQITVFHPTLALPESVLSDGEERLGHRSKEMQITRGEERQREWREARIEKNEMLMWKYKEMRGRREEIKGDMKRGITLMF